MACAQYSRTRINSDTILLERGSFGCAVHDDCYIIGHEQSCGMSSRPATRTRLMYSLRSPGQPAVPCDIGGQDGGELAGRAHGPLRPGLVQWASLTHDRLAADCELLGGRPEGDCGGLGLPALLLRCDAMEMPSRVNRLERPDHDRSTGRHADFAINCKREGLLWTCGIAPRVCPTTRSGHIVLGSDRRARRNGGDGDGAQLPIEFALDALHGADADVMLGGKLANAGAAPSSGRLGFCARW